MNFAENKVSFFLNSALLNIKIGSGEIFTNNNPIFGQN